MRRLEVSELGRILLVKCAKQCLEELVWYVWQCRVLLLCTKRYIRFSMCRSGGRMDIMSRDIWAFGFLWVVEFLPWVLTFRVFEKLWEGRSLECYVHAGVHTLYSQGPNSSSVFPTQETNNCRGSMYTCPGLSGVADGALSSLTSEYESLLCNLKQQNCMAVALNPSPQVLPNRPYFVNFS